MLTKNACVPAGSVHDLDRQVQYSKRGLCYTHAAQMARKTVYGKCPKCRARGDLVVMSGTPGKEKFKCNQCYHVFGMDEL